MCAQRSTLHRFAATLVSAALAFAPVAPSVASPDGPINQEFAPIKAPASLVNEEQRQHELDDSTGFPPAFDLRNVDGRSYVTPVRSGAPFAGSGGFGATAAAETSVLGSVLADDPSAQGTLNLSQKQLSYFEHTYLDDPASPQNGEGTHLRGVDQENRVATNGAIFGPSASFLAANTYATSVGPIQESRDDVFAYHGKDAHTSDDGTSYAADDDWAIEEGDRFKQDYMLVASYLLPATVTPKTNPETNETTFDLDDSAVAAIKKQLTQKRAVAIGYHGDETNPATGAEGPYLNAATWAHYTWDASAATDEACIVGWDDNYSSSNFSSAHQPPTNGAWLVKGSRGAATNEFPDRGNGDWGIPDANGAATGYFWLSYHDRSIADPEAFVLSDKLADAGTKEQPLDDLVLDQYDLMPANTVAAARTADPAKTANVFRAQEPRRLVAVSFEVATPKTEVTYDVYLLPDDASAAPESGDAVAHGERAYDYAGYYTETLDQPVSLDDGQAYAIVITQKAEGGYVVGAPVGVGENNTLPTSGALYSVAVVNEGESLVFADGAWQDWSRADVRADILSPAQDDEAAKQMDPQYDNFAIKGVTLRAEKKDEECTHEWSEPAYTWSEDNMQATATRVCNKCEEVESETVKTTSEVIREATQDEPGTRSIKAAFASDWATPQAKEEEIPKLEAGKEVNATSKDYDPNDSGSAYPVEVTYAIVKGDGSTWTKSSAAALPFSVERSVNDNETYFRFAGVMIDDKVIDTSNYGYQSGSVIIALKPGYLETLSAGNHKFTAVFNDGSASATFTVLKASAPPNVTRGTWLARTGDSPAPWAPFALLAVVAVAVGLVTRNRDHNHT